MDSRQAEAALTESARRREQTIHAGTAPWPWRPLLAFAAAFVVYGVLIDIEMIWLGVVLIVGIATFGTTKVVKLRRTRPSAGWATALGATFLLALLADIAVQFLVRGADLPLPNTAGAAAAAATVILVGRPIQARAAASLRP